MFGLFFKEAGKTKIWYNFKQKVSSQNKGQLLLDLFEKSRAADTRLIMGSSSATVTKVIVKWYPYVSIVAVVEFCFRDKLEGKWVLDIC